jgi:hypothetical protein
LQQFEILLSVQTVLTTESIDCMFHLY